MKCSILFLILCTAVSVQAVTLQEARKAFDETVNSREAGEEFLKKTSGNHHPVISGYKAAVMMTMAKHYFNPWQKLSHFNQGRKLLEQAIARDPYNVELRYIRLVIQMNAPAFLNYHHSVDADTGLLLSALDHVAEKALKERIKSYLSENQMLVAGTKP